MPAFDVCHEQVVRALEKDGWIVNPISKFIDAEERTIFIDIEASKPVNGQTRSILFAEVKCFSDENRTTHDLYLGLGQYILYQAILEEARETAPLYLAIPKHAYEKIFDIIVMKVIRKQNIKLLVINLETETTEQWIE